MSQIKLIRISGLVILILITLVVSPGTWAAANITLSEGQTIYVPIYSHVYSVNQDNMFLLTATLSIRNIDIQSPITIVEVNYYDDNGQLIEKYLDKPLQLAPLQSTFYVVAESDERGGVGANFIIKWEAAEPVNPPITESVMIGTKMQQGISFVSPGVPINTK